MGQINIREKIVLIKWRAEIGKVWLALFHTMEALHFIFRMDFYHILNIAVSEMSLFVFTNTVSFFLSSPAVLFSFF